MKFKYINPNIGNSLKNCENIAVIKFAYIGDSVWMIPFIKNLKRNLPHIKLTVIVNRGTEPFFINNPYVDNVITFDRRSSIWSYFKFIKSIRDIKADALFELTDTDRPAILSFLSGAKYIIGYNNENRFRNRLYTHISSSVKFQKHFVQYHLDILRELGFEILNTTIEFNLEPHHYKTLREKIPQLLNITDKSVKQQPNKIVIIHPGSRNVLRQWGTDRFAQLCDLLYESCRIILTAGPNEGNLIRDVTSLIKTPLPIIAQGLNLYEFAALCEMGDLFIGNDSGPIHIAAAKNIFVAGIYGPTKPEHVSPWTDKKIIIQKEGLICGPCYVERCNEPDYKKCLYSITPQSVFNQIKEFL